MYINATGYYIPAGRIPNSYYLDLNGLDDEWITRRTGIKTRSRMTEGEDQYTMAHAAVEDALRALPYPVTDIDLIVAPSYTVVDTVATVAHVVQRDYNIDCAKALYLSSACSSFINGLEVVECYFKAGKAKRALIVSSEVNSLFANERDPKSGHLWGDGAVAFFLSAERIADTDHEVLGVYTCGLGNVGKGPDGVHLRPADDGISMPEGRDVFVNACTYMIKSIDRLLQPNGLTYKDLGAIMTHQANLRIVRQVARTMDLDEEVFLGNIAELGNTGSASCAIVFAQNAANLERGTLSALTVFGGGYSTSAALIRI